MSTEAQKKNHNRIRKLATRQRSELNSNSSTNETHVRISREEMRQVVAEVWKNHPQDFSDPQHELDEATLDLINREINQRLYELRHGSGEN